MFQFPPEADSVDGLRLSLFWGQHQKVHGLDFGILGNVTLEELVGTSFAAFANVAQGDSTIVGGQFAGIMNLNSKHVAVYGFQAAFGANVNRASEGSVFGMQMAVLSNFSPRMSIYGIQFGLANFARAVGGIQLGLYNESTQVSGLQIGLVNVAKSLTGLQLGLINRHTDGAFPFFPFINFGF